MSIPKIKPTESEIEVLQVLWKNGPSTVRFINDELNKRRMVGYTTTLKIIQIMFEKEILSRIEDGKTHIYTPKMKETDIKGALIDRMLETVFEGSATKLIMQVLGQNKTTTEEIDKIRELLDQVERKQKND